jgi:hypothetical protein
MSCSYGRFSVASTRSVATTTAVTDPAIIPWTTADSPLSAKKSRNPRITAAEKNSTSQTGSGTMPSAACNRSRRASSRVLVWESHASKALCSLAVRGSTVSNVRNSPSDHGLMWAVSELDPIAGPFLLDDGASVADQLAREPGAHVGRHQLGRLELLNEHKRFGFGAAPRVVVLRAHEEDDEPKEERESGRRHAEHPRRTVTVLEAAPLRCPPTDEQHRGGHGRRYPDGDQYCPHEIHKSDLSITWVVGRCP